MLREAGEASCDMCEANWRGERRGELPRQKASLASYRSELMMREAMRRAMRTHEARDEVRRGEACWRETRRAKVREPRRARAKGTRHESGRESRLPYPHMRCMCMPCRVCLVCALRSTFDRDM